MPYVATLTPSDIEFGKRVTEALDKAKFPFNGTLWLYDESAEDWEFVVVTPLVDEEGRRESYLKLSKTVSAVAASDTQLLRLTVMSPNQAIFKAIRSIFKVPGVGSVRVQNTVLNGIPVQDAYLYRVI